MRKAEKILSLLLTVCMLAMMMPGTILAEGVDAITDVKMAIGSAEAKVSCTASVDAVVVAALYDEDTGRMRAVGTANTGVGSNTVTVALSEEKQEGDELRVFLVDGEDDRPLVQCWIEDEPADDVEVGSILTFGHYEQDNDLTNGKEPIEWRVLAKEDGKALVTGVYALDCQPYNESGAAATWETCTLRSWLNQEFYNAAFDSGEQAAIVETIVTAEDNPLTGTDAGNDTLDHIFLFSIGEAKQYFTDDSEWESKDRACKPTAYALAKGSWAPITEGWSSGFCAWWLRSPGAFEERAAIVLNSGGVMSTGSSSLLSEANSIRPALWIDLSLID